MHILSVLNDTHEPDDLRTVHSPKVLKDFSSLHGRVGIYKGTFDPIHKGHLALAEKAREELDLEYFCFCPHSLNHRKNPTPLATRIEMISACIRHLPNVYCSPIASNLLDWGLAESSIAGTQALLRVIFGQSNGGITPIFIGGGDKIEKLIELSELPDRFINLCTFAIVGRDSFPPTHQLSPSSKIKYIPPPEINSASSEIKRRLAEGQKPRDLADHLPEAVIEYLEQHSLYR